MRDRQAQSRARQLRHEMSKAETVLWTQLKGRALGGWKFRRQHPVGPYITDFACLEAGLVIEIDGATHAEDHEIEHDRKRSAFLTEQGFETLRVSNLDVYDNLDGVVRLIADTLAPLGPSGHSPRKRGKTDSAAPLLSCSDEAGGEDGIHHKLTQGGSLYD